MLELKTKFPHLDKPAAFDTLIEKKLHTIARRLDAQIRMNTVEVIADVTQRKANGQPEKFAVMIMVDCTKPKKFITAKKSASDFKKALNEALAATEKILRRESGKRETNRRKSVKLVTAAQD